MTKLQFILRMLQADAANKLVGTDLNILVTGSADLRR